MPIRPDLRHFYAGPKWKAIRAHILERDNHRCKFCGAPNKASGYRSPITGMFLETKLRLQSTSPVQIQLGIAHLDHNPANMADENLAALCRRCHLLHDRGQHKETRSIRKDAGRPLLRGGAPWMS